ncbi:hypothetical protein OOZ54_12980 [Rhodopseudomonas palustris]|uniref:hypothetical protein n=1 Tax=Rhodopseudomonas palustris TaxID=1076 RepID=UPI0022F0B628|nr:hypothetical protein [Rhodopseudomonas palustris]WBU27609.1 hypothetical protein OOZ54_12980 [Rhodopseudomonas palustris]
MSRTSNNRLGIRQQKRVFSSPVALAFVRTVMARRGVTEAEARKVYLDYLSRATPTVNRGAEAAA